LTSDIERRSTSNLGGTKMIGTTEAETAYQFTGAQALVLMTAITAVAVIAAAAVFLLIV
jgi:hypothetical protein